MICNYKLNILTVGRRLHVRAIAKEDGTEIDAGGAPP